MSGNLLQPVVWLILFVVPGYVAASIKHYWLGTTTRVSDKTAESIVWSLAVYLIAGWLPPCLFDLGKLREAIVPNIGHMEMLVFQDWFLRSYMFLIALAATLAYAYVRFSKLQFFVHLFRRTPFGRVWDEFWSENTTAAAGRGVWVQMKDGTEWAGYLRASSDSPGDRSIWLKRAWFYEGDHLNTTPTTDLLIDCADVYRLFILESNLADWLPETSDEPNEE